MRFHFLAVATAALALTGAAQTAAASTITHAYDFNGAGVTDTVGSQNGALLNGASVSGGALNLDGVNDYVQFGSKIVDTSGAFSVFMRVEFLQDLSGITEIISQGFSGGPGFYIGENGSGGFRLGDFVGATTTVPSVGGFHDLLFTNGGGILSFSIDNGTPVTQGAIGFTTGGTDTRLGSQFAPFGEFFHGRIDEVRTFTGVATYAEATAPLGDGAVPEPATWAMMLVGFGAMGAVLRRRQTIFQAA